MATHSNKYKVVALILILLIGAGGFLVGDTASAIAQAGEGGNASMRIGTITAYDQASGTLTVNVGGTDLPGVFYNPAYLPVIGDTVAALNSGPTWYVMGSTINALARTVPVGAIVQTAETCTSLGFTDLATPGPSVTVFVGATGRVIVDISAQLAATTGNGAVIGVALTGTNVVAADSARAWSQVNEVAAATTNPSVTRRLLLTGLNPGLTTFTLKYAVIGTSSTIVSIRNREIAVQAY